MLYRNICIIGLGTLGGFLAKHLCELDSIKSLLLIDYDTVEPENIENSIYTKEDIGNLKTKAICKKLYNTTCRINVLNKKFIEGETKIPKSDLIIDCRDFTYNRGNLIDARLYISFRNLIIDCRKNVNYERQHEGKYVSRISKIDLNHILFNVATLIDNGLFEKIVKRQNVYEISMDFVSEEIEKQIKNRKDVIYDTNSHGQKLINLSNNYSKILDLNKNDNLTVYLGDKNSPYTSTLVPRNNLRTIQDIILSFTNLTKILPYQYNYYIISVSNYNNKYCVELLPETGSA